MFTSTTRAQSSPSLCSPNWDSSARPCTARLGDFSLGDGIVSTGHSTIPFEAVEIDPHDRRLLEQVGRLRVRAWSAVLPKGAVPTDCWLDDFELAARHWCVFHDGEPIAAARMSVHSRLEEAPDAAVYEGVFFESPLAPIASFNRLVTDPRFRGRGLSKLLDVVRLSAAREAGCRSVVGVADGRERLAALGNLGFRLLGTGPHFPSGHFLRGSGANHVVFKKLEVTALDPDAADPAAETDSPN